MRPLIQLWLFLWAGYVGAGAVISLLGFRHIDLSFASFFMALSMPLIQSIAVLTLGALRRPRLDPAAADPEKPRLALSALALVAANVMALQVLWVTAAYPFGPVVHRLVLTWMLAIELVAIVVLTVLVGRRREALMGRLIPLAIALPAAIAALGLAGVPWADLASRLPLPPLTPMVGSAFLFLLFLGGLFGAGGRLRPLRVAGKLAEGALGMAFGGGLLALLIAHGGGQLGPFWKRLEGTALVLCAALLLAALLEARREEASWVPAGGGWIWWTSPAARFGLLVLLLGSYLLGIWLSGFAVGVTPPLSGEWLARTAFIPATQTASLLIFVKARRV